jgi:glycyl-tRNA synthetase beta chain
MMNILKKDFLFEIGTEELPARQLESLQQALLTNTLQELEKAKLTYSGAEKVFATPRRLAIFIPQLQTLQADQVIERKGPSYQNAFDDQGRPTKACEGFAKSCQTEVSALEQRDTDQGKWLFAVQKIPGKPTAELLPSIIKQVLEKLPIAKPMHWGSHNQSFLRPVRWIVMLLGNEVVPCTLFDLPAGNRSYGHRFMQPEAIVIHDPADYEQLLYQAKVVADFKKRKNEINQQLHVAAQNLNGTACVNQSLLTEVTGLVEWPQILTAQFDPRFLNVPDNALIAAMESHQKSFALRSSDKKLLPQFLTVANIISSDEKQVIAGNERVMRARLSDAEFFYQKDLATPLANYRDDLKRVVFQTKLGSLYTKSEALAAMANDLAKQLKSNEAIARQAGQLAKCDLRTEMVSEFPELQGEMGRIYAQKECLSHEVSAALFEQYLPRFANDKLPETQTGMILAIADRLLNLVGIFGASQIPTGEKDPFALRRAAIGLCRIFLEKKLELDLMSLLITAEDIWLKHGANITASMIDPVYDFIIERLRYLYLEQGIKPQIIESVLCLKLNNLYDIDRRIKAFSEFQKMPEAESLGAAQKRVENLLQKEKLLPTDLALPDPTLFELPQETALSNALIEVQAEMCEDLLQKNYTSALRKMARLKKPVDDFFDHVMVMADDRVLRHNRLCLLGRLSRCLNLEPASAL